MCWCTVQSASGMSGHLHPMRGVSKYSKEINILTKRFPPFFLFVTQTQHWCVCMFLVLLGWLLVLLAMFSENRRYIFTVWHYTSEAYAVLAVCQSVRLSQAGIVSKRLDKSSWSFVWMLPSTYPTLCCKEIWVSAKIRVLPSGALSRTPDFENFASARRSLCQQNS